MASFREFCVITVSDSCYNKEATDTSGPHLEALIRKEFGDVSIYSEIVPDEKQLIEDVLNACIGRDPCVVFTTGGTGFAPRDTTPEATRNVLERECPLLATYMFFESMKNTCMAALSRGVIGIKNKTVIINFPGSKKAVNECFTAIKNVLPHAVSLVRDNAKEVKSTHRNMAVKNIVPHAVSPVIDNTKRVESAHSNKEVHSVPDTEIPQTNINRDTLPLTYPRVSPYPPITIDSALELILSEVKPFQDFVVLSSLKSPVNVPPTNASKKDGYAMKSPCSVGVKRVIGYIPTGASGSSYKLADDECFKINTGAVVPKYAQCVVPVENTNVVKVKENGEEKLVHILESPSKMADIRSIGSDLRKGDLMFGNMDYNNTFTKSLMASVGTAFEPKFPKIAIISTGNELLQPDNLNTSSLSCKNTKVYDSNTTMLKELLEYFGFKCYLSTVLQDDALSLMDELKTVTNKVDFIISTGGVSMGDKDHIKTALVKIGYDIKFGRVKVKPGLPTTFATKGSKLFFGLPGNPVSAFVTFHIFVLPALKKAVGCNSSKLKLSTIAIKLDNSKLLLDPRPEFVRATITSRRGVLYAKVTGNQCSSTLRNIVGADALVQLPERTSKRTHVYRDEIFNAYVLRHDFISNYE